jgi:hypothetical protein
LLDDQAARILARARQVRASLISLLLTVLSMLGCSVMIGLSLVPALSGVSFWGSGAFFLAGLGTMAWAILLAIGELLGSLDPVAMEHHGIEDGPPPGF